MADRSWSFRASPARKGVDLLLERYHDAEIAAYDAGDGEPVYAHDLEDGTVSVLAPAVPSPWVRVTLRWYASICSQHVIAVPGCPRCLRSHEVESDFAIWKATGDVYPVEPDGSVGEDPCLTP